MVGMQIFLILNYLVCSIKNKRKRTLPQKCCNLSNDSCPFDSDEIMPWQFNKKAKLNDERTEFKCQSVTYGRNHQVMQMSCENLNLVCFKTFDESKNDFITTEKQVEEQNEQIYRDEEIKLDIMQNNIKIINW
jgi:hypothetical protein